MAVDILGLGYKVDTGDIKRAERDLDKFASANKKAAGNVDDLSAQSDKASRTTSSLARSLGTLAGAFITLQAASSLVRIADEYTKFTAQLRLATNSLSQFQTAYGEVVSIARSSQSDIGGLGTLYARITNATREMGLAQGDVAKISETVALSLRVSGATAAESASAMLQLSQAFGSGVLRGEEFNAVNEAAPGLMRALADAIGAPVGALREMASNGELTADVLARAFKDDELLAKLREQAKEVQTVGSAITGLKNELTIAIGELDSATGASAALAGAITSIAGAIAGFDQVYPSIEPFLEGGVVVGGFIALNAILNTLVATTIPRLLAALPAIYAAMLPIVTTLGPLVAGFAAFAAAVGYSTKLAKEAQDPSVKLNKLFEEQARLQAEIAERGADATNSFLGMSTGGKTLGQQLADVQANIGNLADDLFDASEVGADFAGVQNAIAKATSPVTVATVKQAKATKEATEAAREFKRIQDEGRRVFEQTRTPIENANIELARLQSLLDQGAISWDTYGRAVFAVEDALEKVATAIPEDEKYRQAAEALMAANKDIADTFKDDLLDSIKTAFLQGGKFSEAFARGVKAELIEAFLDPALGRAINQAKSGNFAGIAGIASAGSVAGGSGAALSALLQNANGIASKLVSISGATGNTAASMLQLGNNLSKIAPYAGSIAALIQGDVRGAAGSALGTYIGGAIAGPIGAAIGASLGGLLGGSKKISATALGPEFGQNVTKALADQYAATAAALGGAAANVVFGAGGNTGRQGQNPNFTLSASFGGRNIFNSNQTREGQADGLFLSGEIALNQANLADQSLRALVAALQETDFADNIDEVVDSVNAATGTFEELQAAIAGAQLLNVVNGFKDMEGAIASLSGASAEVVGEFFELVGGLDGLNQGMAAFYDAFTSEQQKLADLTESVTNTFANLGLVIPNTREDLVELIDSLDLRNEADQRIYATILALVPALDQLLPAFDNVSSAVDNLTVSLAGMAQQITNEAQQAINKQIELSQKAATQARSAAQAYFTLRDSLTSVGQGLLGGLIGPQAQFGELFAKAITGDLDALGGLGSAAQAEAQRIKNTATDPVAYLRQTMLLKQQVDQAAAVADVLGAGADFQAQLFDVQTAALEVIRDQLEAGNLTADLLTEQIGVLENIGQMIMNSAQLTVGAVQNASGQTVGALFDSSGNVIAKLGNETVLQIQAAQNQNNALGQQINNSLTGQTAALGGLSQQQIKELQGIDDTQTEGLSISEIISRATEGSETLLLAVLDKLGQQDTSGLAIVGELQKGNDKISGLLFRLVNIAEKQEAEQIRLESIAALNKEALAAKAQIAQSQEIRGQSTNDLSSLQQQAYNLASQFGVFLNEKTGAVQLANTAKFGVNDQTGLYQQMFGQISFGSGGNPSAFKNEFYKPGGLFAQIQAEAAQLAQAKQLLDPANTQLNQLRQQIIDLGGIPEFAKGGMYQGGVALVGEQGPELINFNQGGRVSSNQDTVLMMQKANDELVAEMKEMRKQMAMLITTSQQTAVNTGKASRIWDDVTQNGTTIRTTEVPA